MKRIIINSQNLTREYYPYDDKTGILKSNDGKTSIEESFNQDKIIDLISCLFDERVSERVRTSLKENSYYQHVRNEKNEELKVTVYVT